MTISATLSSATHHAMPPEFCRKSERSLNTRFHLPTVCGIQREADLIFDLLLSLILNPDLWLDI